MYGSSNLKLTIKALDTTVLTGSKPDRYIGRCEDQGCVGRHTGRQRHNSTFRQDTIMFRQLKPFSLELLSGHRGIFEGVFSYKLF